MESRARVLLNAFRLDTNEIVERVFKHELKFTATTVRKNEEKDLSRGVRNE